MNLKRMYRILTLTIDIQNVSKVTAHFISNGIVRVWSLIHIGIDVKTDKQTDSQIIKRS